MVGKMAIAAADHEAQLARVHAVWGLGQMARMGQDAAVKALVARLKDEDPELQAQALKTLTDLKSGAVDGKAILSTSASNLSLMYLMKIS